MKRLPPRLPPVAPKALHTDPAPAKDAPPPAQVVFTDKYGIKYVDGLAKIETSIEAKLSMHYQSFGVHLGMQFTTAAEHADEAVQASLRKLHDNMEPAIKDARAKLDEFASGG